MTAPFEVTRRTPVSPGDVGPPWPLPPGPAIPPLPESVPPTSLQPPVVFVAPSWEYKHLVQPMAAAGALDEDSLNLLGQDGWELVGVVAQPETVHFYFKRERYPGR